MLKKITYFIHSLLGTIISLLFLMWFITGLVLIYHPFPDVNKQDRHALRANITDSLPAIQEVLACIPNNESVKHIQLNQYKQNALFQVTTSADIYHITADLQQLDSNISKQQMHSIAKSWIDAPISHVDTLHKQDIWIMYSKYLKELPIYKVHFSDSDKHQLYLSSKTGEVQQFTSQSERIWAYLGSIPHKLYIPALRQHTRIWINTLTTLATLSFITVLTGLILGFRAIIKRYRIKKEWSCPYSRPWYKWHHILGLLFGLFLLTWSISGMMALQKVPQWLVKTQTDYKVSQKIKGAKIKPTSYPLDYRTLQKEYPDLKQITWDYFQGVPIYHIVIGENELAIDASTNKVKELNLEVEPIQAAIEGIHGTETKYSIQLIHHYEEYYLPWSRHLDLPVYKVEVDTPDKDLYYIAANTAKYKYLNTNRKVRKWLFNGFHYLHFKPLIERPILWHFTLWLLALGCIGVTGSGVYLGFKYLSRTYKQKMKNK